MIELVSPLAPDSPAAGWVKRIKVGPYHTCYEVRSMASAIAGLRDDGFAPVSEPVPAVAFEMRLVAFLWSAAAGLVEVLEAQA
jgi:methylmalonyl-CoA/ethylmalonyl-CoA epimerase